MACPSTFVNMFRASDEEDTCPRYPSLLPLAARRAAHRARRGNACEALRRARRPRAAPAPLPHRRSGRRRSLRVRPRRADRPVTTHREPPPQGAAGSRRHRGRAAGHVGLVPRRSRRDRRLAVRPPRRAARARGEPQLHPLTKRRPRSSWPARTSGQRRALRVDDRPAGAGHLDVRPPDQGCRRGR